MLRIKLNSAQSGRRSVHMTRLRDEIFLERSWVLDGGIAPFWRSVCYAQMGLPDTMVIRLPILAMISAQSFSRAVNFERSFAN
jgi:hypothetical protein